MKRIIQAVLRKIGYRLVPVRYIDALVRENSQHRADSGYYQATINNLAGFKDAYETLTREESEQLELAAYKNALEQALRDLGAYRSEFDRLNNELEAIKAREAAAAPKKWRRPVASR